MLSAKLLTIVGEAETHYYIDFNGTTTVIDCGSGASTDNLHDGAFTVEAWIAPDSAGESNAGRIAEKSNWFFYTRLLQGGIHITALIDCATTDGSVSAVEPIWPGRRTHVAMTWDDASYQHPRLWIDGVEANYQLATNRSGAVVSDASANLYVGNNGAGDRAFDGKIGWSRISNVVRYTEAFTPPLATQPPATDANTVLLLKLTEGDGTDVADSSGNGNNGTLADGSWGEQSPMPSSVPATTSGENIVTALDPTHAYTAARVPHQRQAFYAQGRYWIFYTYYHTNGGPYPVYYASSTDAVTWTAPTYVVHIPFADAQWGIEYDEATGKLHIATNITTDGGDALVHNGLRYRRGTPGIDGVITWDDVWQTVIAVGNFVGDFSMAVDSDGHVWFGYGDNGSQSATKGNAKAIRNANTDGTWSTAAGFPATIQAGVNNDAFAVLAPLDDGTMYAVVYEWANDMPAEGHTVAADGTVTADADATLSNVEANSGGAALVGRIESAAIHDGNVHLVYQDSSQNIKYRKKTGAVWGSETTLSDNTRVTAVISSPRLSFGDSGEIYVAWSQADALWLCTFDGDSWNTPVEVKSDGYEASYEHAMPALLANGDKLQMVTLLDDYTLKHYLLDV